MLWLACECRAQQAEEMNVPAFALTALPSSLRIYPGTACATTIAVTNTSGFPGNVSLTVSSQLPRGVFALLTPRADGSSRLAFIAARDAQPGSVLVTVQGASGGVNASATIALAVYEPTYVLSISPIPFTIARGSTFASTVTVVPWGDFKGAVDLSGYRLPSGVKAEFSPSTTDSTSELTWTADNSAPTGSSDAIIAGSTAGITSYSQFQQNVVPGPVPAFAVGVSPAYLTISQGNTATDSITIAKMDGFNGNVNLSVTQLPGGISAAFGTDRTDGNNTLTLSANDSADVGVFATSVWGSASGQSTLSPLYLTVQPTLPFALEASPAALTLAQGASNSSTIAVSPPPKDGAEVGLAIVSSLPDGIAASLTPQHGTTGYSLRLTATSSVAPGQYFVNVSGTSGLQTVTTSLPFTVEQAKVAATPVFSPAGGAYTAAQTVTISVATPEADVYFTTDDSMPTADSTRYSGAFVASSTETIRAIAIASGYSPSSIASVTYVISSPPSHVLHIDSMSPAVASAGSAAFTLTMIGSGFSQASSVYWDASPLDTQFVSTGMLMAHVPASKIAVKGVFAVSVRTPAPDGISNTMQFEVDPASSSTLSSPIFSPAAAQIFAGQTAVYDVSLPGQPAAVSATCMNLPAGATCTYISSSKQLMIQTAPTSPKGTFQVAVIFNETFPSTTNGGVVLPLFMFPFARKRNHRRARSVAKLGSILLAFCVLSAIGCAGVTSARQSKPQSIPTQQITSSGLVGLTIQ